MAVNVGIVAADVMGLQVEDDRSGKRAWRLTTHGPKAVAPGPALEPTLRETLDSSLALSAEAVSSHLRGHS